MRMRISGIPLAYVLLILLSVTSLQYNVVAQPYFSLKVSPSSSEVHPLEVIAGESARFIVSIEPGSSNASLGQLTGKVGLDIIFGTISLNYTLNPRAIAIGESAVLEIPISERLMGKNVEFIVKGTLGSAEAQSKVVVRVVGSSPASVSPQVAYVGIANLFVIVFQSSNVVANVSVASPGEPLLQFVANGTKVFSVNPRTRGTVVINGTAAGYRPFRYEIPVIDLPTTTDIVATVTATTTATITTVWQVWGAETYTMLGLTLSLAGVIAAFTVYVIYVRKKSRVKGRLPLDFSQRVEELKEKKKDEKRSEGNTCQACGQVITTKFCPFCGTKQK